MSAILFNCCQYVYVVEPENILTCPSGESNPGRWIYKQTLYYVAVKAGVWGYSTLYGIGGGSLWQKMVLEHFKGLKWAFQYARLNSIRCIFLPKNKLNLYYAVTQKLVFKTDYRLMQVYNIAECSTILSTFIKLPFVINIMFCLFLSDAHDRVYRNLNTLYFKFYQSSYLADDLTGILAG